MLETITTFTYSILFLVGWFLILKYRKQIKHFSWSFAWAETYLWRGSTYLVIIAVWCAMVFLWVIFPFWWLDLIFKR